MATPTLKIDIQEPIVSRALQDSGVIDVNVSDDQVDDRIDEALQYLSEYHYDGDEEDVSQTSSH